MRLLELRAASGRLFSLTRRVTGLYRQLPCDAMYLIHLREVDGDKILAIAAYGDAS